MSENLRYAGQKIQRECVYCTHSPAITTSYEGANAWRRRSARILVPAIVVLSNCRTVWIYNHHNPRGGSPYFMNAGCGVRVAADFLFMKIGRQSGGRGPPGSLFAHFCTEPQKWVAAHGISLFIRTTVYMHGQTPTRPAKWVWPAGHLLSPFWEK